jgi:hypothetical protein
MKRMRTLNDSWNLVIHIAIGTASVVQYTLDGGTNWINLNNGENLVAGSGYTFMIQVMKGDAFNLCKHIIITITTTILTTAATTTTANRMFHIIFCHHNKHQLLLK